ncbi:MAG: 50S ribosomal protein L29 [Lentisphaerae bacterium]|nr:50S ribosomal protein L29 [Lentisphaerota bacterium]
MKAKNLREQTEEELAQQYETTIKDLFDVRVKKISGDTSEQPLRVRTLRRDVARIKTVIREKELQGIIAKN